MRKLLSFVLSHITTLAPAALFAVGVAYVGVLMAQKNEAQARARDMALRADSIAAVADTTRELLGLTADSLRLVERRVVQAEIRADSLDDALRRETRARAELSAVIQNVDQEAPAEVEVKDSVLTLRFNNVYQPPVTLDAVVSVRYPTMETLGRFSMRFDTANIVARLGCGEEVNGVRTATLLLETPDWLRTTIDHVQQDPGICTPVERPTFVSSLPKYAIGAGAGILAGVILTLVW